MMVVAIVLLICSLRVRLRCVVDRGDETEQKASEQQASEQRRQEALGCRHVAQMRGLLQLGMNIFRSINHHDLESLCNFWSGHFDPIKILPRIPR